MKIFSLPHLVINELIRQFEPTALIKLSFCSKKAHSAVKMFAKNRKGVELQLCSYYQNGYSLSVSNNVLIHAFSNQTRDLDTSALKTMHGLRWSVDEHRNLYTYWQNIAVGCRRTTNYVCDLLNVPVSTVIVDSEEDLWLLDMAQRRQEQTLKKLIILHSFKMNAESYSSILSCNTTDSLKCISTPPRGYHFDGPLPSTRNILIFHGFWITREHLLDLESQNAQLLFTRVSSFDINALLRYWLDGGLANLKYLKIHGRAFGEEVYEGIRNRLERFQRGLSYTWDDHEPDVKFNSRAFHLRKEHNVVATVMIHEWSFTIAVWPDLKGDFV